MSWAPRFVPPIARFRTFCGVPFRAIPPAHWWVRPSLFPALAYQEEAGMTLRGPPESLGLEREIRTRKQVRDYAIRCAIEGGHEAKTEIRAKTRRRCSRRERWRNHALSQGGLKRSRAPGASPLRNSGAGSRVGCIPPGPMRDRAAHTPRWGQESRSHPKPKLRPVRIDVNSRLVTASPRRQSSAGYITNIDWRRRPRNLRRDICGPQRTRRRRIRKPRTGTATPDRRELPNHTAGNAGASVARRIGLHVVCLLVDHNTGTARVEQRSGAIAGEGTRAIPASSRTPGAFAPSPPTHVGSHSQRTCPPPECGCGFPHSGTLSFPLDRKRESPPVARSRPCSAEPGAIDTRGADRSHQ